MSELKNRINNIFKSNIIIDSLSHGPLIWSDSLKASVNEMINEGMNAWDIIPKILLQMGKKLVRDDKYFEEYTNAWKEAGVNCVSWTVGPLYSKPYSFEGVFHNFAFMTYIFDHRKDFYVKVLKADDIEKAYREGKRAVILNFQSMEHIGTNLDLVELYYMMGIRIMQLTYNSKNPVGTGCTYRRDRGLTEFGLQVVDKINELGAIVDVSHCGIQTSKDAVENSKNPIISSHTFSKKLYNHDRGKDDDLLMAIAEKGGYIGVLAVPGFITSNPKTKIDDWLNHMEYIVNLIGIDNVGIGTDFYGFSVPDNLAIKIGEFMDVLGFRPEHKASFLEKVQGFESYRKFPNLIEGLISRGYSDQEIKKIAGENFLRVFRKVVG